MPLYGIDISSWQGDPDFETARPSVEFCAIKLSEGSERTDDYFNPTATRSWEECGRLLIPRIAYHYAHTIDSAQAELDWFSTCLNRVGGLKPGDGIWLDLEEGAGNLAAWALGWLRGAEQRYGFKPVIYSGRWFMDVHGITGNADFQDFGLALAAYQTAVPPIPAPWQTLAFWQYSDSAVIPGIAGKVDRDQFFGTVDQLKLYGLQPAPPPVPDPRDDQIKALTEELQAAGTRLGVWQSWYEQAPHV